MSPLLKSTFRYLRQEGLPILLKAAASFGKNSRRSVAVLARMQAGIEAAGPSH
jgi:hypothetical protein